MQETQETWVQSLGGEDPLEKEMTPHSSMLAWSIPWTEEPGGIQSMGSQRVRHDLATEHMLTSILAASMHISTNSEQGLPFLYILIITCYFLSFL